MEKICIKCKSYKSIELFYVKEDELDTMCTECRIKKREQGKKYREKNKDKIKDSSKKYYLDNRDKLLNYSKEFYLNLNKGERAIYQKEYRDKNMEKLSEKSKLFYEANKTNILKNSKEYRDNNKEYYCEYNKKYRVENKESINKNKREYQKKKREEDPVYRNYYLIKNAIHYSLKKGGFSKKSRTNEILGCSLKEFKEYIESKFEPWMTWENQGNPSDGIIEINKSWDIDHIIPISTANTEQQVIELNHYTNLQPLCSYVNRFIKRDT